MKPLPGGKDNDFENWWRDANHNEDSTIKKWYRDAFDAGYESGRSTSGIAKEALNGMSRL